MPNLNVKGESSRPMSAPSGGGGASKVIIVIVIILALGGTLFVLNSTGIVKLWGKKKAQPAIVDIPAVEETFTPVTQEPAPVDTPQQGPEQQVSSGENLTKLESNVKVIPQSAQPQAVSKPMVVTGTGMYTVQISSWPTEQKAAVQAQLFIDAGFEAFVEPIGGWYRVCIGRFESKAEAKAQIEKMEHMLESMPIIAKVGH